MASQKVQMGGFCIFHRTIAFIVCQYIFIVICERSRPAVSRATQLLVTASTSLGKDRSSARGQARMLRQTDGAGRRLTAGEAPRSWHIRGQRDRWQFRISRLWHTFRPAKSITMMNASEEPNSV